MYCWLYFQLCHSTRQAVEGQEWKLDVFQDILWLQSDRISSVPVKPFFKKQCRWIQFECWKLYIIKAKEFEPEHMLIVF